MPYLCPPDNALDGAAVGVVPSIVDSGEDVGFVPPIIVIVVVVTGLAGLTFEVGAVIEVVVVTTGDSSVIETPFVVVVIK